MLQLTDAQCSGQERQHHSATVLQLCHLTRGWFYRFVAKESLKFDSISAESVHVHSVCTVGKQGGAVLSA